MDKLFSIYCDLENLSDFHLEKIKKLLSQKGQNIIIVTHRNPDGDAMGASTAIYNFVTAMGHTASMVVPNAYPQFLNWLPGIENTLVYDKNPDRCNELFKKCNILFIVDFNDPNRIREFSEHLMPVSCYKVLIDHHPDPGNFADLMISDTSVSSTCELAHLFMEAVDNHIIDKAISECIYTGIMTDTGCFSFNSSKRQTFEVVARLLDKNIDKDKIFGLVYNNYSFDRMRLLGHCLQEKMVYLPEYKTAYITLSQKDIKKYNFKVGDSEGFVNIPLSIKGVVFSALLTEREDIVKISLRSKGGFAVNEIAGRYFEGGGHANAAGGESKENLAKTIDIFTKILKEHKEDLLNANS